MIHAITTTTVPTSIPQLRLILRPHLRIMRPRQVIRRIHPPDRPTVRDLVQPVTTEHIAILLITRTRRSLLRRSRRHRLSSILSMRNTISNLRNTQPTSLMPQRIILYRRSRRLHNHPPAMPLDQVYHMQRLKRRQRGDSLSIRPTSILRVLHLRSTRIPILRPHYLLGCLRPEISLHEVLLHTSTIDMDIRTTLKTFNYAVVEIRRCLHQSPVDLRHGKNILRRLDYNRPPSLVTDPTLVPGVHDRGLMLEQGRPTTTTSLEIRMVVQMQIDRDLIVESHQVAEPDNSRLEQKRRATHDSRPTLALLIEAL